MENPVQFKAPILSSQSRLTADDDEPMLNLEAISKARHTSASTQEQAAIDTIIMVSQEIIELRNKKLQQNQTPDIQVSRAKQ